MKKFLLATAILITVVAIAGCGSSRKYGCPSAASISTNNTLKV